jgi:hypothetical protein
MGEFYHDFIIRPFVHVRVIANELEEALEHDANYIYRTGSQPGINLRLEALFTYTEHPDGQILSAGFSFGIIIPCPALSFNG